MKLVYQEKLIEGLEYLNKKLKLFLTKIEIYQTNGITNN